MNKYIILIKEETGASKDYIYKKLTVSNTNILLVFNEVLTSSDNIGEFILKKLVLLSKKQLKKIEDNLPACRRCCH